MNKKNVFFKNEIVVHFCIKNRPALIVLLSLNLKTYCIITYVDTCYENIFMPTKYILFFSLFRILQDFTTTMPHHKRRYGIDQQTVISSH